MTDDRYPEILRELKSHVARILAKRGLPEPDVLDISHEVADFLHEHLAGQQTYWPKGKALKVAQKHLEIWNAFNGHNYAELAKQFDLSERQVYNAVDAMRQYHVSKTQQDMFSE